MNSTVAIARRQPVAGLVILVAVALAMAGIALLLPPITQPLAYHNFAEQRTILGIPHFGDLVSNIAYAIVALLGFVFLVSRDSRAVLARFEERLPYIVFFAAIGAVAIGSAYYHAAPTNQTLFWDRLPIIVAFTTMLAAFLADRNHTRADTLVMLPLAVTLGVASLLYWRVGEAGGEGDLRFYYLVQAFAFVLIPLICILFRGRHTNGRFVLYILLLYGAALACEQLDSHIFQALGGIVSGHTIKHILSALAIYMVVPMLRRSKRQPADDPGLQTESGA